MDNDRIVRLGELMISTTWTVVFIVVIVTMNLEAGRRAEVELLNKNIELQELKVKELKLATERLILQVEGSKKVSDGK
jgi:hypothetical protein